MISRLRSSSTVVHAPTKKGSFVSGATTIDFMSDFKPRDFDPDPPISDATPSELVLDMKYCSLVGLSGSSSTPTFSLFFMLSYNWKGVCCLLLCCSLRMDTCIASCGAERKLECC